MSNSNKSARKGTPFFVFLYDGFSFLYSYIFSFAWKKINKNYVIRNIQDYEYNSLCSFTGYRTYVYYAFWIFFRVFDYNGSGSNKKLVTKLRLMFMKYLNRNIKTDIIWWSIEKNIYIKEKVVRQYNVNHNDRITSFLFNDVNNEYKSGPTLNPSHQAKTLGIRTFYKF